MNKRHCHCYNHVGPLVLITSHYSGLRSALRHCARVECKPSSHRAIRDSTPWQYTLAVPAGTYTIIGVNAERHAPTTISVRQFQF